MSTVDVFVKKKTCVFSPKTGGCGWGKGPLRYHRMTECDCFSCFRDPTETADGQVYINPECVHWGTRRLFRVALPCPNTYVKVLLKVPTVLPRLVDVYPSTVLLGGLKDQGGPGPRPRPRPQVPSRFWSSFSILGSLFRTHTPETLTEFFCLRTKREKFPDVPLLCRLPIKTSVYSSSQLQPVSKFVYTRQFLDVSYFSQI